MKKYVIGFAFGCALAAFIFLLCPLNLGIPSAKPGEQPHVFIRVIATEKGFVYSCNYTEASLPEIQKRIKGILNLDPAQHFIVSYPNEMSRLDILKLPGQLNIPRENVGFIHEQVIQVPGTGLYEESRTSASSQ
jgi:hypothetical protein